MSSRTMSGRVQTFGIQEKAIRFRIVGSGANWNNPQVVGGRVSGAAIGVASVVRSAAGKFLVTLEDAYFRLVSAHATYQGSGDAEDLSAQIGAISNLGTSLPTTIVVKTKAVAANVDPATVDANSAIHVDLVFEDSNG